MGMISQAESGTKIIWHPRAWKSLLSAIAISVSLCVGGPAHAQVASSSGTDQTSASADQTGANALEEIEVTATRVDRAGYTAPTPTTVITNEALQQEGITNIAQALNQMPEFKADTNPTTNGIRSITPGANYADLYGLGAIRTLVLVDGQRFVPQVATDLDSYQVDLNQVPSIMIDRTDVVTGGASAQWGSDAIGGVVNIILKKNFTGLETEASGGVSGYGDNQNYHLATLGGMNLGEKGHVEAALEYDINDGVGSALRRPWGREGAAEIPNPSPATNGLPINLIESNVQYSTQAPGGIIVSGPLKGTTFGPGGAPSTFTYGSLVSASNMVGGSNIGCVNGGCGPLNGNTSANLEPPTTRFNFFSRGSYDFTDSVQGYAVASYAQEWGGGYTLAARDSADVISINNAYLPPTIKAAMTADGLPSISLGRVDNDIGLAESDTRNYTSRVAVGLQGTAFSDWKWNIGAEYGDNYFVQHVIGNRIHANYNNALDAVVNPANGQIVCAANLTTITAPGCQPLDLFGNGSPSPQAIGYVTGTSTSTVNYIQRDVTANLNGEPFSTWAGPVSVATGLEYRYETQNTYSDPIDQINGYEANNSEPLHGDFDVGEAYFETVVPLASKVAWARELDLNGAVRFAHYSTSAGTQWPWKIGLTYNPPVSGLLLRATRSQDIRAPNLYELYSEPSSTEQPVAFGSASNPLAHIFTEGNRNLVPEVAQTWTGGFTYQPDFVPGLQFSTDYYQINIKDEITTLTAQQESTFCYEGYKLYCPLINFGAGNVPEVLTVQYENIASNDLAGVDVHGDYRIPMGDVPGNVLLHASANWTLHELVNTGLGLVAERSGDVTGEPHFRATTSVTYNLRGLSVTAQTRFIDHMHYDNTLIQGVTINDNDYPSVAYLDLFASYQMTDKVQLYGTIYNLLNRSPPNDMPNEPTWYDNIGITFQIGVRAKLF
jgi:iron complex outermembrane recepter protein